MMEDEMCLHGYPDGSKRMEPLVWCDLCGWGFNIIGNADGVIHFCHRHSGDDVKRWWLGEKPGYFDLKK